MGTKRGMRAAAGVIATALILLSASAGQAAAATKVNFVHAVPGAGDATLEVSGGSGAAATLSGVGFAEASKYSTGPSGRVTITLTVGGKQAAKTTETFEDGAGYTVVAEPDAGGKVALMAYRAGQAQAGSARVRAAHAAGELSRADFMAGDHKLGTLARGDTGNYATMEPGSYELTARRPGTPDAVIEQPGVSLAAGTASTAYAVGSGGERARFVMVQDAVDAPQGGPATGMGGLAGDDGTPWLAALLAALAAGALGGVAYTRTARRRDSSA